jgi:hypothetical protein
VRRRSDHEINRATGGSIAAVMPGALAGLGARGQMPTSRTGAVVVIAVVGHDKGLRQGVGVDAALRWVRDLFTGSEHEMIS